MPDPLARWTGTAIADAAARVAGSAWPTPFVPSPSLSDAVGGDVRLKLESVQATGSFKIRGAANAVARLVAARPDVTTVMTASAGNHGLAIATACARHGLRARVHLPRTAPDAKRLALRRLGADLVEAPTYDEAEAAARAEASDGDASFISPYDDDDVIAGAGTVTLEMLLEWPEMDVVIVPVGGGGLVAGAALAVRELGRAVRVVGAEAAASPVFSSALAAGRPVTVDVRPTLADGLAGNMDPDTRTFGLVRALAVDVVPVTEEAIAEAMRALVLEDRVVAEGAGSVGVAALLQRAIGGVELAGRRIGVIVSGRNVDGMVLRRVVCGA